MLDLSAVKVNYFEVKLPDNTVLNIKTPSVRMRNEIALLPDRLNTMNEVQQEEAMAELIARIFSRNTTDRVFDAQQIKAWFEEPVQNAIIREYGSFIKTINNLKN